MVFHLSNIIINYYFKKCFQIINNIPFNLKEFLIKVKENKKYKKFLLYKY